MLSSTIGLLRVKGCIMKADRDKNGDNWSIHWCGRRRMRGDGQAMHEICRQKTGTNSTFAGLQAAGLQAAGLKWELIASVVQRYGFVLNACWITLLMELRALQVNIEFNFWFFWWLEFASQVDNLVIKYINDRSQTRSWQCVDVFWYVHFHQRVTCDFVTIVSKYIEFNVLGAYSSEYETTVCMFFLPVDTLLTFDNGTKYVPGKLSSTVYSGWGRHCWKWEGKSEWPKKDQAVWFVTCVLVAVIWITSCINDMHVPYHTHQM
jgi:hypothetical protein